MATERQDRLRIDITICVHPPAPRRKSTVDVIAEDAAEIDRMVREYRARQEART